MACIQRISQQIHQKLYSPNSKEIQNIYTSKLLNSLDPRLKILYQKVLSDEELAEHFANFFIGKIENIRDKLKSYTLYSPIENNTIGKLSEFKPLSNDG